MESCFLNKQTNKKSISLKAEPIWSGICYFASKPTPDLFLNLINHLNFVEGEPILALSKTFEGLCWKYEWEDVKKCHTTCKAWEHAQKLEFAIASILVSYSIRIKLISSSFVKYPKLYFKLTLLSVVLTLNLFLIHLKLVPTYFKLIQTFFFFLDFSK